jgi:NAD(P)-dependent dehydrogenase (short-subunit alcohol dehydrogenase family)
MELANKVAVVLGGTGGVGEGIVKALLTGGAKVIVPVRDEQKAQKLRDFLGDSASKNLIIHPGTVDSEQNAEKLQLYLQSEFNQIDIAVASLGGWNQGYAVHQYSLSLWHQIIANNLTSHFLAIKTLIPLMNPIQSYYIHINGMGAEQIVPMASLVTMTAAAQKTLILTLAEEQKSSAVKVWEFILGPVNTRSRIQSQFHKNNLFSPEEIGQYMIEKMGNNAPADTIHYLLAKK